MFLDATEAIPAVAGTLLVCFSVEGFTWFSIVQFMETKQTEPEPDRIGIILTGTGTGPKKVNRIRPDWPDFYQYF